MKIDSYQSRQLDISLDRPISNIEVIGSSGVGKSTLLKTLCRKNNRIQAGISLSKLQTVPEWIETLQLGLKTYWTRPTATRWFSRTELRSMVYLDAWYRVSERANDERNRTIVWDQGPIYRLAMLREFGPSMTQTPYFDRWWNDRLERWAAKLDLIVWLDAPDRILLERVYERTQEHEIKNKSPEEGYEFLQRYRNTAGQILDRLVVDRGLKVLRYNTSEVSSMEIANCVLEALEISSIAS